MNDPIDLLEDNKYIDTVTGLEVVPLSIAKQAVGETATNMSLDQVNDYMEEALKNLSNTIQELNNTTKEL